MLTTEVREGGLIANFHRPSGSGKYPAIIVIGGSGGGLGSANAVGVLLAELGYATLALAYFGMETLPERLEEIPLEYFKQAIDFTRSHSSVATSKIGMLGTSKGGEGALLVGATYRDVGPIVAYSPSNVVFQAVQETWSDPKSSWTLGGKAVPFVPFQMDMELVERHGFYLGLYLSCIQDREAVERAEIPVERINGPILLISGTDDAIWPSHMMCERVVERLTQWQFAFPYRHLTYKGAGHLLAGPSQLTSARSVRDRGMNLGGAESVNSAARDSAWREVLDFFAMHLR
jgi:dienelactone hydrolase